MMIEADRRWVGQAFDHLDSIGFPRRVPNGAQVASYLNDYVTECGKAPELSVIFTEKAGSDRQHQRIEDRLDVLADDETAHGLAEAALLFLLRTMSGHQLARTAVSYEYMPWGF